MKTPRKTLSSYDSDCVRAALELKHLLLPVKGDDEAIALTICAAMKEYACECDKRITDSEWAQKYRAACEHLGGLHEVLTDALDTLEEHAEDERKFWGGDDEHGIAAKAEDLLRRARKVLSPAAPSNNEVSR